jgi:signal transduction histidine kinase
VVQVSGRDSITVPTHSVELGPVDTDLHHRALEAMLSIAEGLDLHVALQRALNEAISLTQARYGAIGIHGPDGEVVEFLFRGISDEQRAAIGPLPQGHGVLAMVAEAAGSVRIDDIAAHPAFAGFPAHHPAMRTLCGAPIVVDGAVFGTLYLADRLGGRRFTEIDEAVVKAMADAAAVAVRNTLEFERTGQRERWQRASTAIDYAVLSGTEPDEVLVLIAGEARRLAGADVGLLALPDVDGELVLEVVDVRNADAAERPSNWSVDRSRRGLGADESHLQVVHRWLGQHCTPDGLFTETFDAGRTIVRKAFAGPDMPPGTPTATFGTAVAIPMRTHTDRLGVLGLLWDHEVPRLGASTIEVAEAFAAHAAVMIVLAQSRAEHERLLVFEDRDRIARDMHDLVVQRVFAAGLSLEGALRWDGTPEPVRDRIEQAVADLDETIAEIRRSIFSLHAEDVRAPGIRDRLLREVSGATVLLGFTPTLTVTGPLEDVPRGVSEHLVAAVREGLSNAARHASAASVDVVVRVGDGGVALTVTDDGIGPPSVMTRKSGIANLAARAQSLGGESRLSAAPSGIGSALTWRVPLV